MVSVIIPTFQRTSMLFFEIEQLRKQKRVDLEIIVINDDVENDPTDEITRIFPEVVYLKSKKKIGPGEKHQMGFAIAKGEYVSFPDDDDYLIDDEFFSKAISIMKHNPEISFVSGNSLIKYEKELDESKKFVKRPLNIKGLYSGLDFLENMQGKYDKPLSSVPTLFRKSTLEQQKFMDQVEMSDSSLYMLAAMGGSAFIMENYVSVYRVHGNSLTTKRSSSVWIINVLRQKETIFLHVRKKLKHPNLWWLRHVNLTYSFFSNTSKNRLQKIELLFWCLEHSHGNMLIYCYVFKRMLFLLFNK